MVLIFLILTSVNIFYSCFMALAIVDDEEDTRKLIERILESHVNHSIEKFSSGEDLLKFLKQNLKEKKIDLILLDFNLSGKNGLEILKCLKSNEHSKSIPVIMVTANHDRDKLKAAFDNKAFDYIHKPFYREELLSRVKNALSLKQEMDKRLEKEKELKDALEMLEYTNQLLLKSNAKDALTGIGNRRQFDISMETEWKRTMRRQTVLSLVMIDVDFFKKYNDYYGHQRGDDVLIQVAKTLQKSIGRSSDFVARYGGEEFSVILPGTDLRGALKVGEKMRQNINNLKIPHEKSDINQYITISLGVACEIPSPEKSYDGIIEKADKALYSAKKQGRNRIHSYNESE